MSSLISRFSLLALLLLAPAVYADTQPLHSPEIAVSATAAKHKALCERIYVSLRKVLENVAARITQAESVDLNLVSMTMDPRHRVYIDFDGMVEMKFEKPHPRIEAKMAEMLAKQVQTNGAVCLDFVVTEVTKNSDTEYHVEFKGGIILLLEDVLSKLVRFGAGIVGTVTLIGIGNDLGAFFDGIDTGLLAESLHQGMRGMTKVVMSLAGVETYDAWRQLRPGRQGDGEGGGLTGAVLAHLGLAILKGATNVSLNLAGMSLGAALGVALSPTVGATIGATIGAAALVLVGNVVYKKATIDMPIKYRLARIKRLTRKRAETDREDKIEKYTAKIEKYENKILKRVSLDLRVDRFGFLQEFMQQIRGYEPAEREAFLPLGKKLMAKLKFEVVEHSDRLAGRMLEQLKGSFEAPKE